MPVLVTSGATLLCTMGTAPSPLVVPPTRQTNAGGRPVATIADHQPKTNIQPFGQCRSLANPVVAAATAQRQGALTPAPCIPDTRAPWAPGSPTVMTGNVPALNNTGKCACQWAGIVSIVSPGQQTITVG
jgi:hypothetical protein